MNEFPVHGIHGKLGSCTCTCRSSCVHRLTRASCSAALLLPLHQLNCLRHQHLWSHRCWHCRWVSRQSDRRDWLHRRQVFSNAKGCGWGVELAGALVEVGGGTRKGGRSGIFASNCLPCCSSRSSFLCASTTALCNST